jgi:hypothetical protein
MKKTDGAQAHPEIVLSPKRASPKVVWAISLCEAILLGAAAWVFSNYWLMLPVRFRIIGIGGLTIIGLLCVIRLVRYYRASATERPHP